MPSKGRAYAASAAVAVAICAACTAKAPAPDAGLANAAAGAPHDGHAGAGGGAHGEEVLACLSSFIPQKCAVSGCHDDQSRAYGMDLSTGDSIFASWVNRKGLDNCGSQLVPRIVPGQPDASFVFRKVTSQLACVGTVSQPMPPPPAAALSADEIEMLRAWILVGAPMHCLATELPASGGDSGVGGSTSGAGGVAGGGGDTSSGAGGGGTGGTPDNPFVCSATMPCTSQLLCHADNCSTKVWDCVTHRPPQEAAESSPLPDGYRPHHACPTEAMDYCGCDGVTFVAPATCPDRPYQHPGRCDDGYNCNPQDVLCADGAPACAPGEAPSVVDECYADCVPATDCRCEFNWECPTGWQCDRTQWRCVTPPPAGGT